MLLKDGHRSLHSSTNLKTLYSVNVISAITVYFNALLMVLVLPFQSTMLPESQGPTWLYASTGLIIIFNYYLWALEMAGYWFKPELEKIELLVKDDTIDQWLQKSYRWGGILTLLTFAMMPGFLNQYLAAHQVRVYLCATFSV
jgi:hypothetical protein